MKLESDETGRMHFTRQELEEIYGFDFRVVYESNRKFNCSRVEAALQEQHSDKNVGHVLWVITGAGGNGNTKQCHAGQVHRVYVTFSFKAASLLKSKGVQYKTKQAS